MVATDDGNDHVRRARPFIEAGLPVFIDKPINRETCSPAAREMAMLLKEALPFPPRRGIYSTRMKLSDARRRRISGDLRWITSFTCKTWERCRIHALKAVYPLLGPGFISAQTQRNGSDLVHLRHQGGAQITLAASCSSCLRQLRRRAYRSRGRYGLKLRQHVQDAFAHSSSRSSPCCTSSRRSISRRRSN